MRGARGIGVALVTVVVASACHASTAGTPSSAAPSPSPARADVRGQTTLAVEASDFYFSPATIVGAPDQTLTITMTNPGTAAHTFTIDGTTTDVNVPIGESRTFEIAFPASGSVVFYCRYHERVGMRGNLRVAA